MTHVHHEHSRVSLSFAFSDCRSPKPGINMNDDSHTRRRTKRRKKHTVGFESDLSEDDDSRISSSPHASSSKAGPIKRPRAILSCGECNRRKTKCDRKEPCSQCVTRGVSHLCGPAMDAESDSPLWVYSDQTPTLTSQIASNARQNDSNGDAIAAHPHHRFRNYLDGPPSVIQHRTPYYDSPCLAISGRRMGSKGL